MKIVDAIKMIEVCYEDPDDENDNCDGCPVAPHSKNCKKHLDEAIETINNWEGEKMKKPMTLEDALEMVISCAYDQAISVLDMAPTERRATELLQAADILRNMAEHPVEKKSVAGCGKCRNCGELYNNGQCPNCGTYSYGTPMRARKIWTETRVLKIVKQKTDVKLEEVN